MPEPLDGGLARVLARVLDDVTRQLASEAALRDALSGLGIEGPDADQVWAFVSSQSAVVTQLTGSLPAILNQLESASPDPLRLIKPVADLWKALAALTDAAPTIELPHLPDAGSVLDVLLGSSIDTTLCRLNPSAWAALRLTGLIGPGRPLVGTLTGVLDSPTGFIWNTIKSLRRSVDLRVAGVLTGPRVTSVVTTPIGETDRLDPLVTAAFPTATTLLGQLALHVAADTFDDPVAITIEILGDAAQPPHFVAALIRIPPVEPVHLGPHVTAALTPANQGLGVAVTGWGSLEALTGGSSSLALTSSFASAGFSLGSPAGLHLAFGEPVIGLSLGSDTWSARLGVGSFELAVPADVAGPLLALLLPRNGIRLRGKLVVVIDAAGVHLEGGVGLAATWPDTIKLPGLVVRDLTTAFTAGDALSLDAHGVAVITLGPITVTIEGLGVVQRLALAPRGDGNLGVVDLPPPDLRPPTGFGIAIDAGILKGSGFLRHEGDELSGALELALTLGPLTVSVQAVAVLGRVDGAISFVVVIGVQFSPAIEIFLGLTLNGVGGIFGLNRTLDRDGLLGLVRSGRMDDIMFPPDLSSRAVEIIASVKAAFPAKRGQFVVGPILKLGWGRPSSFVTLSVGLIFTFPEPVMVVIVGSLHLALPADALAIVNLNCSFAGGVNADTGDVFFDASLERSTIGTFEVSGDLCLRAGSHGFVFSAGGFHPKFTPPAELNLPALRRLAISVNPSPILAIRAESYFAVTSSTVQFGAAVFMQAELGPIGARGHLGLDVLFQTEPTFHFTAEISGSFALTVSGEEICGLDIDVLLEGPGRWHAHAHASIHILFIKVSGTLELAWGTADPEPRPAVDVAEKVMQAMHADPVWAVVLPAVDSHLVQLRDGAAGLHPLGSLRLTQTVAPLGVPLQRFGTNPVTSPDPVTMTVASPGAGTPTPRTELFAPAQFFSLTDDEKLAKPGFAPYSAGFTLDGDAWLPVTDPVTVDVVYEEATDDGRRPPGLRDYATLDAAQLGWAVTAAAGAHDPSRIDPAPRRGITVSDVTYGIADAATGAWLADHGADTATVSMARTADRVALAAYERMGVA